MIMCKADVTGSFVPTVAKQMQSVDPAGEKNPEHGSDIYKRVRKLISKNICLETVTNEPKIGPPM